MKNIVLLFLALLMLISLSACKEKPTEESKDTESSLSELSGDDLSSDKSSGDETSGNTQSDTSIPTDPDTGLPIYVPGSIKLYEYDKEIWPNGKPYRDCWYMDPANFRLGQTKEERQYFINHAERDPERMLCVQYIEYFNVPKEVFVAGVERLREYYIDLGADMSFEEAELPNADILYTFDDEIINHYYRYE